jgi:hypothetical protein
MLEATFLVCVTGVGAAAVGLRAETRVIEASEEPPEMSAAVDGSDIANRGEQRAPDVTE